MSLTFTTTIGNVKTSVSRQYKRNHYQINRYESINKIIKVYYVHTYPKTFQFKDTMKTIAKIIAIFFFGIKIDVSILGICNDMLTLIRMHGDIR